LLIQLFNFLLIDEFFDPVGVSQIVLSEVTVSEELFELLFQALLNDLGSEERNDVVLYISFAILLNNVRAD